MDSVLHPVEGNNVIESGRVHILGILKQKETRGVLNVASLLLETGLQLAPGPLDVLIPVVLFLLIIRRLVLEVFEEWVDIFWHFVALEVRRIWSKHATISAKLGRRLGSSEAGIRGFGP